MGVNCGNFVIVSKAKRAYALSRREGKNDEWEHFVAVGNSARGFSAKGYSGSNRQRSEGKETMTPSHGHGSWVLLFFGLIIGIWGYWQMKKGVIYVKTHTYVKTQRPIFFWCVVLLCFPRRSFASFSPLFIGNESQSAELDHYPALCRGAATQGGIS
jgi:hypothetical protein